MSARATKSRIAIVTGAGSGIGRAAALALLGDGWSVVLAGRRLEPLEQVADESGAGARAFAVPTDVADPESVQGAVRRRGRALRPRRPAVQQRRRRQPARARSRTGRRSSGSGVVDINLNGMFYCIQQAFRTMQAQTPRGGRIINNGSISATAPRPNSIAYTATKHAVEGLTKTAALDGRKYDIAVGQIDVGNAMTEMAARMAKGVPQANGEIAVEPVMDVAIVGQSVLYMANLPLEANVLFHTVMATKMPFVGRG